MKCMHLSVMVVGKDRMASKDTVVVRKNMVVVGKDMNMVVVRTNMNMILDVMDKKWVLAVMVGK